MSPRLSPEAAELAGRPEHFAAARRIARAVARRAGVHPDPPESAAMLALVLAARDFDPRRGPPFRAYARTMIRYAALHAACGGVRRVGTPGRPARLDDADLSGLADPAPSAASDLESEDVVEAMVAGLSARHRAALRMVYLESTPAGEIGPPLGVSRVRGYQIHGEALDRLRRRFAPHLAAS